MKFHPDGNLEEPGLLYRVRNFAHNNNGAYKRIPTLVDSLYAQLATGRVLGSGVVKPLSGSPRLYTGSTTKVYEANGAAGWTDRSGAVTFAATTWEFAAHGDYIVAANGASKLQVATSGNFADISDAPTGPKIIYSHANALVALGSSTNGAAWYRCKTADHTVWTPAGNNDAGSGTLYGGIGGALTAGGPWENLALAWKSRAMYAGIYVGNADPAQPSIRWQVVASDIGCVAQFAWIATEVGIVFVSERGIHLFNGNKPIDIDQKIRKTFMAEAMTNRGSIFCTMDEGANHVYIWIRPSGSSGCTAAYIWNWKTGEWGYTQEVADKTGLTIGDWKTPVRNVNYRDIATIGGFSTNSTETANLFWDDTNDRLLNLSGIVYTGANPSGDGFMRTGFLGRPDRDTTIVWVRPISDAFTTTDQDLTLNVIPLDALKNPWAVAPSAVTLSSDGRWDVVATARYFYLEITCGTDGGGPSIQRFQIGFHEADSTKIQVLDI